MVHFKGSQKENICEIYHHFIDKIEKLHGNDRDTHDVLIKYAKIHNILGTVPPLATPILYEVLQKLEESFGLLLM